MQLKSDHNTSLPIGGVLQFMSNIDGLPLDFFQGRRAYAAGAHTLVHNQVPAWSQARLEFRAECLKHLIDVLGGI
jgi:hypothetical protein